MSDMNYINKYFQMHSTLSSRQPCGTSALHSLHSQISNTVIDYSPWMRQQRRTLKSAGTTTTATFVGTFPRRFFKFTFQIKLNNFSYI